MNNPTEIPQNPPLSSRFRAARGIAMAISSLALASSSMAATPPVMFGVNLSGGEAGGLHSMSSTAVWSDGQYKRSFPRGRFGWDYNYQNQNVFNYYRNKGITLVRLPIRWERIQHSLGATLDATEMTRLDAAIGYARAAGMQVLLDLHNYNEYSVYVNGTWTPQGYVNAQPNPTITIAHFSNLWSQLAARYANNPTIYGYDLMNEPKGSVINWQPAAQAAVNAIRVHDKKHWIVVEGVNWSGAQSWVSADPNLNNSSLNISDAEGKLIYSAHSYWDRNYQNIPTEYRFNGVYASYALENGHPDMGIDCMRPFVDWIKARGYNGLVGEYGVPWATDAASWSTVVDRSLAYLKTNGISGTYWAGGYAMGAAGNTLSCQTNSLTDPNDLPSMTAMRKYGGVLYETEAVTQVTSSGEAVNLINENPLSQGQAEQFMANGVGDYITYTVPNVPAGTYTIYIRYKGYNSRGRFQLAISGANGAGGYVNQGAVQDLYYPGVSYGILNLGSKTFTTTGAQDFRFTVTGKNSGSAGYNLLLDYIQLQK